MTFKELKVSVPGHFTLEKEFTTAWLKQLVDKGYYTDKISDSAVGYKRVDCYIRSDVDSYCCEIKIIKGKTFPLSDLRPNQWKALRQWFELGGTSILVIYSMKYNDYKIISFDLLKLLDTNVSLSFKFT